MFIHLLHLGCVPYAEGLAIQARVVAARKQGRIGDTLLLLEHPPVLTLGRNASRANILVGAEWLASHGVELHEVDRGGDVTYHGPGQLVGYPIVDLRGEWPGKRGPGWRHLGPVDFVRLLEESLIRACADFGVMTKRIPKCTGVWTLGGDDDLLPEDSLRIEDSLPGGGASDVNISGDATPRDATQPGPNRERKLAAIGIHVSQGITSHGFALNVTTHLGDFDWIVPCGIRDRGVTSLEQEADPEDQAGHARPTMDNAIHAVARNFGRVFQRQMLWCMSIEQLLAPEDGSTGGHATAATIPQAL